MKIFVKENLNYSDPYTCVNHWKSIYCDKRIQDNIEKKKNAHKACAKFYGPLPLMVVHYAHF